MKNLRIIFLSLVIASSLISCEEVIDLDLEEGEPRLVIDASLIWYVDTPGDYQQIKLSQTTGFYEEEPMPVTDAEVIIMTSSGQEFNFNHNEDGFYVNTVFNPRFEEEYTLNINYQGETYTASSRFVSVPGIDFIEQNREGGFSREDLEIEAFFTDPEGEDNSYLFRFNNLSTSRVSLEIYEDEFTDGNQVSSSYSNDELAAGDEIFITMEGITKPFYNYLFILQTQGGDNGGGPFQSQPATVKGNIVNETNPDNYPFGYFRLSETDSTTYIVE